MCNQLNTDPQIDKLDGLLILMVLFVIGLLIFFGGCHPSKPVAVTQDIECKLPDPPDVNGALVSKCLPNTDSSYCCLYVTMTSSADACIFAQCLLIEDKTKCPTNWKLMAVNCGRLVADDEPAKPEGRPE